MTRICKILFAFCSIITFSSGFVFAQIPFASSGDAELLYRERGGRFGGSIPDGTGGLLFTDFANNRINRVDLETGDVEVFDADSGGANGLRFDADGGLVVMEGFAQRVTRRKDGQVEVLADGFDGKSFNAPNDLVFDSDGGFYFTDPNLFAQVQREGVYYMSPERKLTQVISNLHLPNGIGLSPDEKTLYVSTPTLDIANDVGSVWAYDVEIPGVVENRTLFASGLVDGLDVDMYGNVFGSSLSSVRAWAPDGELIWSMPGNGIWHVTIHDPSKGYPNTLYLSTRFGELYKVELVPDPDLPADFDGNGELNANDIDLLTQAIRQNTADVRFDLDDSSAVDGEDLAYMVGTVLNTWNGDANLDGEFNSSDFIAVFQSGKYETRSEAGWADGDWNADGFFDSGDFVAAFEGGGYEHGPRDAVNAVSEPSGLLGLLVGLAGLVIYRRQ